MKNNLKVFENVTNEELLDIYKDIIGSKELGIRPRTTDKYAQQIKEICHFETFSDATDFVINIFFEEIAMRYFKNFICDMEREV